MDVNTKTIEIPFPQLLFLPTYVRRMRYASSFLVLLIKLAPPISAKDPS